MRRMFGASWPKPIPRAFEVRPKLSRKRAPLMRTHQMPVELRDVTLVAVSSVALNATAEALSACLSQASFGKALLLSDRLPSRALDPRIKWHQVEPIRSRVDYSRFVLHDLADHVSTSHALLVQWDGYILRGSAWDPAFLEFDYIGAIWPQFRDGFNVGNGGFSLRSRKLLCAARALAYCGEESEDVFICRTHRRQLESNGIRFAPEHVARAFSYERTVPSGREFGFHGSFNLARYLSRKQASRLFRALEWSVLNHSEHKQLLGWAITRGYGDLALVILLRLLRRRYRHSE